MNSRKQNNSRRHPLVRFVRSVYRLLKVLLKPKQHKLRTIDARLDRATGTESFDSDPQSDLPPARLVTVGELFEQIKWQLPPAIVRDEVLDNSQNSQVHDVSRN
jgi:hypothetical protein